MDNPITMRPATATDYPLLADLLQTLAQAFIVPGMPPEAAATFLRENDKEAMLAYREQGHVVTVAEIAGELAGFIAIRPPSHLFHLFVAEPFQRRGVARALWCASRGNATRFTVNSSPYAIPVYTAMGFACAGPLACHHGVTFQPMTFEA
ncbi:MAG TPA: GNAT family N-acetyltransferase [Telluria sp.]|jgi:ribosomal protein S18 acetylase RimI-like enzyme